MGITMWINSLGISQILPMNKLNHFQTQTRPMAAYNPRIEHVTNGSLASDKLISSNNNGSPLVIVPPPVTVPSTLGHYLARRLVEIGVSDIFSVPGDSNLVLFDYFVAEKGLNLVGCCNELNAGYAADGYARNRGVGACAVTFTVGSLSLINAIAGAYSEDLPVICIVGGPNSNDYGSKKILHHTIGLPDFSQELRCFQNVTCYQAVIDNLEDAQWQIDKAICKCLEESKPVYISICCNLVAIPHPSFSAKPLIPLSLSPKQSNQMGLEMAVEKAADLLNTAIKPVMIGGKKLRPAKAEAAFLELANTCGYAVAVTPSAKGMFPENHPHFIGTYWGTVSTAFCGETVEIADASIFVGATLDELETVGYSLTYKKNKAIMVKPDGVVFPNGASYGGVQIKDFLRALGKRLKPNLRAYENYRRIYIAESGPPESEAGEELRVNVLFKHIQKMLSSNMTVIAETGDSWFHSQKLKLPKSCGYEIQLLYASIGWSLGATLGYAQSAPQKRLVLCIGDGSFQMAPQDVSTMLKLGQNNIIFLINNGGYTIEVEIHDGPYNIINNWDYTAFVEAVNNHQGNCWTTKVHTEEELVRAIEIAMEDRNDYLCFIEVIVHRDDTSKELLEFGSRIAAMGSHPPKLLKN
ncbi:pyruvate decarboxylase 1-like [Cucumis melo var. makuwa]|uniref:pyruvate decarboxylase n=1 Tax=Cucumis melo var. makuwa TaxID=1194695 RepID=A0A5D3E1K9_CUCMM|nr:pyruvate decarboxylase 1-like [Cucumis melo var. makuwa]